MIFSTGANPDKVNVNGGAIAIGHPLGATGSRLVGTMVNVLENRKASRGLIAICEGGGMANGVVTVRTTLVLENGEGALAALVPYFLKGLGGYVRLWTGMRV